MLSTAKEREVPEGAGWINTEPRLICVAEFASEGEDDKNPLFKMRLKVGDELPKLPIGV